MNRPTRLGRRRLVWGQSGRSQLQKNMARTLGSLAQGEQLALGRACPVVGGVLGAIGINLTLREDYNRPSRQQEREKREKKQKTQNRNY
jgi:hypothetical protein